jgi:hypothetical protein
MKDYMNALRTAYTGAFALSACFLSAYAMMQLLRGVNPTLSWLGLFFAATSPITFLFYSRVFRPKNIQHPVVFSMLCGLGVAISMVASWKYGNTAGMVHVWAGCCLVGWVLYLRWRKTANGKPSVIP